MEAVAALLTALFLFLLSGLLQRLVFGAHEGAVSSDTPCLASAAWLSVTDTDPTAHAQPSSSCRSCLPTTCALLCPCCGQTRP